MEYLTWNIDPVLISIGGLRVHWYGLLFATGIILGYQLVKWIYQREAKNSQHLDRLLFYLLGGTLIGARLGHTLLYDPGYYLSHPLKIVAIWEGGLASHGGAVGALIGLYLYQRTTGESYRWLLDRVAIAAALAGTFIRIGNLFNSEIVGLPTTVPWAIIFSRVDTLPRHPTQLYEALAYAVIFVLLLLSYKKWGKQWAEGALFGAYLVLVFTSRFLIELVKSKQESYTLESWMSTGQLLSLPFIVAGVILIILAVKKQGRVGG
ncbi:MAG: prolipoprotein diacylglyceryl transferase [Halothiobacillaceae bacterium]|nr:MAG: prolipoprotein diacylglyceryl transferase [Halothiobacillaceae bacterium]